MAVAALDRAAAVRRALRRLVARRGFHGASMSAITAGELPPSGSQPEVIYELGLAPPVRLAANGAGLEAIRCGLLAGDLPPQAQLTESGQSGDGRYRARTSDLLLVRQALSQLS